MQNLTLKSAAAGVFLFASMSLANAAGGMGTDAYQGASQMRSYTAQAGSSHLDMGRSVATGNAGSTTCELPEPAISPNGIASLVQLGVCR